MAAASGSGKRKFQVKPFRKLMLRLSQQLKQDEVHTMTQLVVGEPGFPGERDIEKADGDAMKFFVLLEKHGQISDNEYDLLMELLETINRVDLVKMVEDQLKTNQGEPNQNQSPQPDTSLTNPSVLQTPSPPDQHHRTHHQFPDVGDTPPSIHDDQQYHPSQTLPSRVPRRTSENAVAITHQVGPSPTTTTTPCPAPQGNPILPSQSPQCLSRSSSASGIISSSPRPSPDRAMSSSSDSSMSSMPTPSRSLPSTPRIIYQEISPASFLLNETPKMPITDPLPRCIIPGILNPPQQYTPPSGETLQTQETNESHLNESHQMAQLRMGSVSGKDNQSHCTDTNYSPDGILVSEQKTSTHLEDSPGITAVITAALAPQSSPNQSKLPDSLPAPVIAINSQPSHSDYSERDPQPFHSPPSSTDHLATKLFESLKSHPELYDPAASNSTPLKSLINESDPDTNDLGGRIEISSPSPSSIAEAAAAAAISPSAATATSSPPDGTGQTHNSSSSSVTEAAASTASTTVFPLATVAAPLSPPDETDHTAQHRMHTVIKNCPEATSQASSTDDSKDFKSFELTQSNLETSGDLETRNDLETDAPPDDKGDVANGVSATCSSTDSSGQTLSHAIGNTDSSLPMQTMSTNGTLIPINNIPCKSKQEMIGAPDVRSKVTQDISSTDYVEDDLAAKVAHININTNEAPAATLENALYDEDKQGPINTPDIAINYVQDKLAPTGGVININEAPATEDNALYDEDKQIGTSDTPDAATGVLTPTNGSQIVHNSPINVQEKLQKAKAISKRSTTTIRPAEYNVISDKQQMPKGKKLYAYQVELATPPQSGDNYIICAPTGSGKTLTAAAICHHFYQKAAADGRYFKALFIVNIRHLTQQQRHEFKERFPNGAVGTIGETEQLKDVFFAPEKHVVMVTAQMVVNALNNRHVSLQDASMIIFDECHHTTQNHPYNEIMKQYLKEKKLKMGSQRAVGESGGRLPQIIGLSASLGVGHGKDAFHHILTLCSNMDAKNVLQVLHNKEELGNHVNAPENDEIRYVSYRKAEQRDLGNIVEGIMSQIEDELWSSIDQDTIIPEHGTSLYEQWIRGQQTIAECKPDRVRYIAAIYLFEYNRALTLYEDLRASDSLKHLEEFMHQRNVDQEQVAIEELCRGLFEAELTELKRICHEEKKSPNPKLEMLANLLEEKFTNNPDSKGIILTRMRLATTALMEFIKTTPVLSDLPRPVKPVRLVGQGEADNYFMTESEQKTALKKFRNDEKCNLLVATDIAQEGLDMPACNFVIRVNFVSNEIGTVQSKGRARAKQSECYLIVEEDSINAKREMSNRQKVKDMQTAMDQLNTLSDDDRIQQITKRQEEIYLEIEGKEAMSKAAKKLQSSSDEVDMLCKECNTYITRASYMRKKGSHFTCQDPDVKKRITLVQYSTPNRYRDTETIGIFKCSNKTCGQQLGIAVNFLHNGKFSIGGYGFGVKSFLFKFNDEYKMTYKQWKKVPVDIPLDDH